MVFAPAIAARERHGADPVKGGITAGKPPGCGWRPARPTKALPLPAQHC